MRRISVFAFWRKPWRKGGSADPGHHKSLTVTKRKDTLKSVSFLLEHRNTIDATVFNGKQFNRIDFDTVI